MSDKGYPEGRIALTALAVLAVWILMVLPIIYMPPDASAKWYVVLKDFAAPIATIIAAVSAG
jgi:hypothetical protein